MIDWERRFVSTARAGFLAALAGVAVSTLHPTAAAALWAVSAYLWVLYLGGRTELKVKRPRLG